MPDSQNGALKTMRKISSFLTTNKINNFEITKAGKFFAETKV